MKEALLLGGLLLGIYFYKQKSAAGNLIFFPGTIEGMAFEGSTPTADVTLQIQNTSNVDIDIMSLAGNVFANGVRVGNVSNFTPVRVGKNSQAILPVKIQFDLIGTVNNIIQAFQTGQFRQALTVEGFVNAGGMQVPVSLSFKVG